MGFFERLTRGRDGRAAARTRRRPSLRERRARRRTREAEARLLETETLIHREADRIRRDIQTSS